MEEFFKDITSGKRVWVNSDVHASHRNIVVYCHRPGWDPNGNHNYNLHNEVILNNHNDLVRDNDIVINLGDVAFNAKGVEEYAQYMAGKHYFIRGNHDSKSTIQALVDAGWTEIDPFSLQMNEGFLAFSHYPIYNLPPKIISCHGHVHNNPYHGTINHFNVSIEATGYKPVLLEKLVSSAKYVLSSTRKGNNTDADKNENRVLSQIRKNNVLYSE